jgi:hypothetical protein
MKLQSIVFTAATLAFASAAFAQATPGTNTPRIDARQAHQQKRIAQGIESGQLTPKEATRLERGQARIASAEAKAKADGSVTSAERRKLTKMENTESKRIHRQKHDAQKAG